MITRCKSLPIAPLSLPLAWRSFSLFAFAPSKPERRDPSHDDSMSLKKLVFESTLDPVLFIDRVKEFLIILDPPDDLSSSLPSSPPSIVVIPPPPSPPFPADGDDNKLDRVGRLALDIE